jgi:hypothetical protein
LLLTGVLSSAFSFAGAKQTVSEGDQSWAKPLVAISRSIQREHKLSTSDQQYLLRRLHSGINSGWEFEMTALALVGAVKAGLFPRQDLYRIVEQNAELHTRWSFQCALAYYLSDSALQPPTSPKALLKYQKNFKEAKSSPHVLNKIEKKNFSIILEMPKLADNRMAAWLVMEKNDLEPASRKWVIQKLDRKILKATEPSRRYWQFVKRVVEYHSRHK